MNDNEMKNQEHADRLEAEARALAPDFKFEKIVEHIVLFGVTKAIPHWQWTATVKSAKYGCRVQCDGPSGELVYKVQLLLQALTSIRQAHGLKIDGIDIVTDMITHYVGLMEQGKKPSTQEP